MNRRNRDEHSASSVLLVLGVVCAVAACNVGSSATRVSDSSKLPAECEAYFDRYRVCMQRAGQSRELVDQRVATTRDALLLLNDAGAAGARCASSLSQLRVACQ